MAEGARGRAKVRSARWAAALLGATALAACLPAAAPVLPPPAPPVVALTMAAWIDDDTPPASPAAAAATGSSRGLVYDCGGLRPARAPRSRPAPEALADLVAVAHPENPGGIQPTPALADSLRRASALEPDALSTFERILLQNTAMGLLLRARGDAELTAAASRAVARFALPGDVLASLGEAPDRAVTRWIGPEEGWTDRKGDQCGDGRLLFHDRHFQGTRAFRPMRVGDERVLVSQLVALDTAGNPHVTSVIGQVEILRSLTPNARACVVEIEAEALRAGAPGGLRAATFDGLVSTKFIHKTDDHRVGCVACHSGGGPGDFADVPAAEAASLLQNRRAATLAQLSAQLGPVALAP